MEQLVAEEVEPPRVPRIPLSEASETDLRRLIRGLTFSEGPALYIVVCEADDLRRTVTERLRIALHSIDRCIVEVDLSTQHRDPVGLLLELHGESVVLSGYGLEELSPEGLRYTLVTLNFQRERIREDVLSPLVLWVPSGLVRDLALRAPDFYDVRSGLYTMLPEQGGLPDHRFDLRIGHTRWSPAAAPARAEERLGSLLDLLPHLRAARPTAANREIVFDTISEAVPLFLGLGRRSEAMELAREARDQAVACGHLRRAAVAAELLAEANVSLGNRAEALRLLVEEAVPVFRQLASEDPSNARWQDDLAVSHIKVGGVQEAQGDLVGALSSYRACLAILERLAEQDPSNAEWQCDLSVGYDNIGDVQRAQGDLVGALSSYRAGLAIRERLAAQDPGNAEWQRALSISYERVGEALMAQGDLVGALGSYRAGLAIRQRLAEQDPSNAEWQGNLSVSYDKIGDVQIAQGDLVGALGSYRAGLAIGERLAEQDPSHAEWQRELSVSYIELGEVQEAQGDLVGALGSYRAGLAIAERLAEQDPSNAQWERDLSVTLERVGDVQMGQGDLVGALSSYRSGLGIAERLAELDPTHAAWQRGLSVSYNRVGDVQRDQGDLVGALGSYRAGLAIAERLAEQDPSNAEWQRDLAMSYYGMGWCTDQAGDQADAEGWFRRARDVLRGMREKGMHLRPDDLQWLERPERERPE